VVCDLNGEIMWGVCGGRLLCLHRLGIVAQGRRQAHPHTKQN
jgi:hypothetical protein